MLQDVIQTTPMAAIIAITLRPLHQRPLHTVMYLTVREDVVTHTLHAVLLYESTEGLAKSRDKAVNLGSVKTGPTSTVPF